MRFCVWRLAKRERAAMLSIFNFSIREILVAAMFDRSNRSLSLSALNTGGSIAFARNPTDQIRADAERLSHIVLEMQRCFVLHLCKELAPGNVSFPQFFLLAFLDHKEVLTMSAIAQKMDTPRRRLAVWSRGSKTSVTSCVRASGRIVAR